MPTGAQRTAIARRITELRVAEQPGPAEETIAFLGDLIQQYAPSRLDDRTVSIKAEAYLDALEDLPAWTVREAIRRWRRGEVPGATPHDLDFEPKPARLRRLALGIADVAKGQALRLQRILDAESEDEPSEAERAEKQKRLAVELRAVTAKAKPDNKPTPSGTAQSERLQAQANLTRLAENPSCPSLTGSDHPGPVEKENAA